MKGSICRLSGITLRNFKNVRTGTVIPDNAVNTERSSMLGIYGQNGSGKTALIEALGMLYHLLRGDEVPGHYSDLINASSDEATVDFFFHIETEVSAYDAEYRVFLRRGTLADGILENGSDKNDAVGFPEIYREMLSASFSSEKVNFRKKKIMDTGTDGVLIPSSKCDLFLGNISGDTRLDLLVAKNILRLHSRSFIFSTTLAEHVRKGIEKKSLDPEYGIWSDMMERIRTFGRSELFVIGTAHSGMIFMDRLPLLYVSDESGEPRSGQIELSLDGMSDGPLDRKSVV